MKFVASSNEIIELRFLAERTDYPPGFLARLFGARLFLRAAIVWTGNRGIVINALNDSSFGVALGWCKEKGWDVELGTRLAFETPLVRVTVPRMSA